MTNSKAETKPITVYRAEANLMKVANLPEGFVDAALAKYSFSFYEDKNCLKCPVFEDRHSEVCDACESYIGTRELSKVVEKNGYPYLSVPLGGTKRFSNLLSSYDLRPKFVDKFSSETPVKRPIKVTRELREWQIEALPVCLEKKRGIVMAPPRSGKTILGVALTSAVNGKTLIIASQREWLSQFEGSFIGKEDEAPFTDLRPKRIGFCSAVEDFESKDVCLATFQQFMNPNGKKILEKIRALFALVLVDEVHFAAALATSRVLSRFNCEYLIGLTGTPNRKRASEEIIFKLLVGPIIYKAKVDTLQPEVALLETGVELNLPKGQTDRGAFSRFVGKLEVDKTRVKRIAKYIARSVKAGHSVMVPVSRQKSVQVYINAINEYFEENVCVAFTGALKKPMRAKALKDIKSGDAKVVVGNIALLSTGLNIPRLSMLIDRVTITSNIPKTIQRVARILTPFPGKIQPKLVIVLDDCDIQRSTARNEYYNAVVPQFTPMISEPNREQLNTWFKNKSNGSFKSKVRSEPARVGLRGRLKTKTILIDARSL